MSDRKPYAVYVITKHGVGIAARLAPTLPGADVFVSQKLLESARQHSVLSAAKPLPLPFGPLLGDLFGAYDCHVFVISVGAVVRMIAPLLRDKKVDPAVVCVDDASRYAICLLSGHVGRGNAFTERIAGALGAQAVVTTASDAIGTLTVDILGRELGWTLDDSVRNVTRGCAAVVNAEPVLFVQETGEPEFWPLERALPEGVAYAHSLHGVQADRYSMILAASDREPVTEVPELWEKLLVYRPKSLVVGVGCDRNAPFELVRRGVLTVLAEARLSPKSVRALATIDKKTDETAFLELSRQWRCPLVTYSAEELDRAPGIENPSAMVERHVGTRGVCEPAALLAAGAERLLVPKRVYTEPDAGRSLTVAIARIPFNKRNEGAHNG